MKLAELEKKLLAAARNLPEDDRVPYGFEHRVMARLRERVAPEGWALWARWLWQAAVPCLALTVLLSALAVLSVDSTGVNNTSSLDEQFQNVVFAAIDYDSW
ncbi:MAG: hypothetical protein D6766_03305 [Verrucomicrobia bacterium]|nr:MAG: hypothetical protein D6766_03305 [Verrucomicrobiota bacterium]